MNCNVGKGSCYNFNVSNKVRIVNLKKKFRELYLKSYCAVSKIIFGIGIQI